MFFNATAPTEIYPYCPSLALPDALPTSPKSPHLEQVIRVAKAGKHAICEKPMGINAKEAQEMIDACEQANVKLLGGYRMHFEANTLEIIRMKIGRASCRERVCQYV